MSGIENLLQRFNPINESHKDSLLLFCCKIANLKTLLSSLKYLSSTILDVHLTMQCIFYAIKLSNFNNYLKPGEKSYQIYMSLYKIQTGNTQKTREQKLKI